MAAHQSVLLDAIRRLILINDDEDRRDEKVKLERQLRETDTELQTRVQENFEKLRSVLETFNSVDEKVRVSQVKVATLRNNLRDCKILLRCKRDDLQRLWKDQMEQKKVIELLEEVEHVKAIPDKLDSLCRTKHFKTAAESVVQSILIMEDKLDGVEALKELRHEIGVRKENLKLQLIDELHGCIYFKAPQVFSEDDSSPKHDKFSTLPSALSPLRQQSIKTHARSRSQTAIALEQQMASACATPKPTEEETKEVIEDVTNLNTEADLPNYMAILVEALYILDAIPTALEALKTRMLGEMKLIIQRSSTEVREKAEMSGELSPEQNQPNLLKMLLDTAFKKYKSVARAHQIVLKRLSILEKRKSIDNLYLYSIVNVWNDIQRVIMRMLQDYLDTTTGRNSSSLPALDVESRDINSFFATKKKESLQKKQCLFRLDHSSHSISITSYMRESKGVVPSLLEGMVDDSTMGHQPTYLQEHLCTPQFRNITVVYQSLKKICGYIELEGMRVETKHERSNELSQFLSSFVENEFLVKIQNEIMKKVDSLTSDSQRVVKDEQSGGMHKERRSNKPLLKSCVGIEHALSELRFLISDLPSYTAELLDIAHQALVTYAKAAQKFFHDLTHVAGDGTNGDIPNVSHSHTWAINNEEMKNHILKLPMWSSLHNVPNPHSNADQTTLEQESWIVLDQIGSSEVKKTYIITSVANIRNLGLLHESMEWFSMKMKCLLTDINQIQSSSELHRLYEVNSSISKLSDHILLTLHLEVRMHCMHYLPPAVMRAGSANEEDAAIEDVGIKEFNRDLCSLEEQLALQLSDMKLRFLFEGIGHLMATVLINSGKRLQRVGSFCITRLSVIVFLLQQNLTNITMSREAELDHARQFYELMRSTPQALLTFATEQEYNFTNAEYEQALAMICKNPDYRGEFEVVQEKLREHFDANRSN